VVYIADMVKTFTNGFREIIGTFKNGRDRLGRPFSSLRKLYEDKEDREGKPRGTYKVRDCIMSEDRYRKSESWNDMDEAYLHWTNDPNNSTISVKEFNQRQIKKVARFKSGKPIGRPKKKHS